MFLPIVVTVLGLWSIEGQASDFTINNIELIPLPSSKLRNGDQLKLQCVVSLAKTTDLVLNRTITLYMDDNKIYANSTTEDQLSYIIPKVRVSHSGKYKCEVIVKDRMKMSEEVDIQVTGLHKPHISVSKNETSEGDEVTVRCEAPEEWSFMVFKFYKISKINQKEESKTKNTNINYAEVKFMVKEGEDILQFKCEVQVITTSETSPSSAMRTVTVVAPFSKPKIEVLPSLNFIEGKNMSVMCTVQKAKSSDDIKLTLQKDGQIIESSSTDQLSFFRVAEVEDKGNYTCKVESTRTSKSSSAEIVIAELFKRPNLTLERSSMNEFIHEGESIALKCTIDGLTPQAARDQKYKFLSGERSFTRGNKLQMTALERYSGSYICKVTISNITKESKPLPIQVYAPVINPVLTHIMRSNKTVVLGDTLELTCKIQSGTPPITYSLLRGNDLLEKQTMNGSMEAQFLVNSSMSHDLGQYRCQATNRNTLSSGKYSNIVNVTVIIPIDGVSLRAVQRDGDVEEGSELSIICLVEKGTLPIDFFFYRKKGNEILLKSMPETLEHFAIYQVFKFSKQDDGAYFCKASNRACKDITSNSIEVRAVLASWKKAVIGTFVSLIILAAIAICAHFHMEKKKKGKDISLKKSRSSKPETTNNEKPAVELKAEGAYYGSVKNEDELHILRTGEESPGNDLQNHTEEHTEANGANPDAPQDAVENNENSTEDAPEANSHP